MSRFIVFLADGFEEIEALSVVDILRRAGIETVTVGVTSEFVRGSHGINVESDCAADKLSGEFDGIVLPGGMPGTLNLEKSDVVKAYINKANAQNKYICAICAAPSVLGHLGILEGKKAVCYPGFEKDLHGAEVSYDYVCVDGKIITARGAGVAADFALTIVSQVCSSQEAEKIRSGIISRG